MQNKNMHAVVNGMPMFISFITLYPRANMNPKVRGNSVPMLVPGLFIYLIIQPWIILKYLSFQACTGSLPCCWIDWVMTFIVNCNTL